MTMPHRFLLLLACALSASCLAAEAQPTYVLKKLMLAESEEAAAALKPERGGDTTVFVDGLALFAQPDFKDVVAPFIGKPIDMEVVNGLANAITAYARQKDFHLVRVKIPNQNITDGALRLAVLMGRYDQVTIKGNRWFSGKLLEEKLGIREGDEVRLAELEEAVAWANTNPFRQVKVFVDDVKSGPGKANLVIGVQERFPYRFALSYDDAGTEILGENRYTASLQFGNLWGLDHQGSYNFITSDDTDVYKAHAFDYRVPLPWRHFLQFNAAYVNVSPTFQELFTQKAESTLANLRYVLPLRRGQNPMEASLGIDFKQTNNNLEYGGTRVLGTKTDTIQLTAGFLYVRRDTRGAWVANATLNASPGGLTSRNTDEAFENARFASSPRYLAGTLMLQRMQKLGSGWEALGRFVGQLASTNLLGNEQLTLGGPSTVRGFNTNQQAGDQGFVVSTELLAPVIETPLTKVSKKLPPLNTRFVAFYDAGQVWYKHRFGFDIKHKPMAGAGAGVRMSVGNNFSLSLEHAWQLTHFPYPLKEHARSHVKVVLAF